MCYIVFAVVVVVVVVVAAAAAAAAAAAVLLLLLLMQFLVLADDAAVDDVQVFRRVVTGVVCGCAALRGAMQSYCATAATVRRFAASPCRHHWRECQPSATAAFLLPLLVPQLLVLVLVAMVVVVVVVLGVPTASTPPSVVQ
jgi:hypothetical protein